MLTIDSLRAFGANVEEGLGRCMKNEPFYLRMVKMGCADAICEKLAQAVAAPVAELTELLRAKTPGDYREDVKKILALRDELKALDE